MRHAVNDMVINVKDLLKVNPPAKYSLLLYCE